MTPVVLALAGLPNEPELVKAASGAGLNVVRRCVDAVDLLGAAALDTSCPVVFSGSLPRMSADVVARLAGRVRIGLAGDALGTDRLSRLGVEAVLTTAPTADATMQQVADVCRALASTTTTESPHASGVTRPPALADLIDADAPVVGVVDRPRPASGGRPGGVIAVWGPMGAPGRTTIAMGVAEVLADDGARVCLIDADTYAPSIVMALGLLEETSGLALACRGAEAGTLSPSALASLTMSMSGTSHGRWRVLGGISRIDRWGDVRPTGLDRLWPIARAAFDVIVVDTGFCLEEDDSPGAWGRQRNAAARSALAEADHVLAVGDDSPLGAARLLTSWPQLRAAAPEAPLTVVRNRATGRGNQWRSVVAARVGTDHLVDVPHDPHTLRACWSTGRSVGEVGRRSPVRRALATLARASVSRWSPTGE